MPRGDAERPIEDPESPRIDGRIQNKETQDLRGLKRLVVVTLVLLAVSGTASVTAQSISFPSPATVISQEGVNLRYLASTSSPSVQVLPFGTVITIAGLPTSDGWYPIQFGTIYGWTMGDYLAAGALDPTAAATAPSLSASHATTSSTATAAVHPNAMPLSPPPAPPAPGGATAGPPPPPAVPAGVTTAGGPAGGPPPPPSQFAGAAASGSLAPPTAPYQATATYYGIDDSAQPGQTMFCGAPFDPSNAHTAATNDWPCGTKLRVSNAAGKSVDVVVADHGAYPQHWIDLTYAGFALLADHGTGEITVTVQLSQ